MTREAPKQQGNSTRENIKQAAMTDSSASSDRRHCVFTIHQKISEVGRDFKHSCSRTVFLTTVSRGDWKSSSVSVQLSGTSELMPRFYVDT